MKLQKRFLASLAKELESIGFRRCEFPHTFERVFELGRWFVHVAIIEHEFDFDVTVDVSIRFDEVEDLALRDEQLLTTAEKLESATLGVELGNWVENSQKRWAIRAPDDLNGAVSGIIEMIVEHGVPFLRSHTNIQDAYEALRCDSPVSDLVAPIAHERSKRVIAIAFLNEGLFDFPKVVERETVYLRRNSDPGLSLFLKFVKRLRSTYR